VRGSSGINTRFGADHDVSRSASPRHPELYRAPGAQIVHLKGTLKQLVRVVGLNDGCGPLGFWEVGWICRSTS